MNQMRTSCDEVSIKIYTIYTTLSSIKDILITEYRKTVSCQTNRHKGIEEFEKKVLANRI